MSERPPKYHPLVVEVAASTIARHVLRVLKKRGWEGYTVNDVQAVLLGQGGPGLHRLRAACEELLATAREESYWQSERGD